ncbi:MAG: hypothetical protein F4X02_03880 [Chloroflexi bacterium]|nr:hypothetical protein [Chloroflexota bacterium]
MPDSRTIRHVLAGTLICLALVGLSATYWALAGQHSLLLREDNPRIIEAQRDIVRGGIYDRNARPLAETVQLENGLARRYNYPTTYSILGYYSLRYGVGGAESAYDALLSGARPIDSIADYFQRRILNLPQIGADIMLSLDVEIQDALVRALDGAAGTAIVLDARSGAVLALASQPSFDPNSLDTDWPALIEAEGKPFFNRALQGNYPLGGNMAVIWLAQAIAGGFDLSWRFTGAAEPVDLGDGMIAGCVIRPGAAELTLGEALTYGCPAPFASFRQTDSAATADVVLSPFAFQDPFTLPAFPQPATINLPANVEGLSPAVLALRQALGQGDITTTPLHLAAVMAAIANDGLAVGPSLLTGSRPTDIDQWQPQSLESASRRMMDAETARRLRSVMQDARARLWPPPQDSPPSGAHVARSFSGDKTQLWLNGFVDADEAGAFAFVVLLEDREDPSQLLSVGRALFDSFASQR